MISKKLTHILLISIFFCGLSLSGQNDDLIYLQDEEFYMGCEKFYPMIMNYDITYIDSAGHYFISPPMNVCEKVKGCKSCGTAQKEYREVLTSHFKDIASMGFNIIRIVGLTVKVKYEDDNAENKVANMVSNRYFEFNPEKPNCHVYKRDGVIFKDKNDFIRQGDIIQQMFDIINEENIPLKILLVAGGHGVEVNHGQYADYVGYLAERFNEERALFGYDLYNEPFFGELVSLKDTDKYQRAAWFAEWYDAIREQSSIHFVTYGPVIVDIFGWDPEVMPSDFFTFHLYSHKQEQFDWSYDKAFTSYKAFMKYVSKSFTRTWTMGETGYPGIDQQNYAAKNLHPIVGSEEEQRDFAESSMKYVRWYGAKGYAFWKYKDAVWSQKNLDKKLAKEYFKGVVYPAGNNNWKPAAYEFAKFDPWKKCEDCVDPSDEDYYNLYFYKYPLKKGKVLSKNSNQPVNNAIIYATVGIPGTGDFTHNVITFSDEKGNFEIRSQYNDKKMIVKRIRISAPNMNIKSAENWEKGVSFLNPFYINKLDPNLIPKTKKMGDELVIRKRGVTIWDHLTMFQGTHLVIKKGVKLIVKGELYVKPGCIIDVEPGGILEIDGGQIFGLCQWEGINVWEKKSKKANKTKLSGQVITNNPNSILNSKFGVRKKSDNSSDTDRR